MNGLRPENDFAMAIPIKSMARIVTCVVRASGERTAGLCVRTLSHEVMGNGQLITVGDAPFPETLASALRAGIAAGRKWTLCVDADVIPFPGAVAALVDAAETMGESVAEVQGLVFDRMFGGWRPAGVHLYRTRHLPRALELIPSVSQEIRPETCLLDRLKAEGLPWKQIELGFGLHDFEQDPKDIYRKCFIHAWKHINLIPRMLEYWRARSDEPDFRAALQGLAAGIAHQGKVLLDREAEYFAAPYSASELPEALPRSLPDARSILHAEEIRIRSLGYTQAPVWDWAERHWTDKSRKQALRHSLAQLAERNVRSVGVLGGNSIAQRQLSNAVEAWGMQIDPAGPLLSWSQDDFLIATYADGRRENIKPNGSFTAQPDYSNAADQLAVRAADAGVRRMLIYGAGEVGQAVHAAVRRHDIEVPAFLETSVQAGQGKVCGEQVLGLDESLEQYPHIDVAIASFGSAPALVRNLRQSEPHFDRRVWVIR